MDQAGAFTSLWEKKNLCIQIFRSQILIFHILAVTCSGGYIFLFVCLFWKHKHCHIALSWHNFIWVIFCEIIQVEKQLQSFQISTETEEMSRDYLIHTNTEAGSKHSSIKKMPDCPNPETAKKADSGTLVCNSSSLSPSKIQALELRCSCLLPPLPSQQTTVLRTLFSQFRFFSSEALTKHRDPIGALRQEQWNKLLSPFVSMCTLGKTHPGKLACLLVFLNLLKSSELNIILLIASF